MPTTASFLASTTVSHPTARMRSPPTPKNSSDGLRRSRASISCAPYISPEASPAEMRIRTGDILKGQGVRAVLIAHRVKAAPEVPNYRHDLSKIVEGYVHTNHSRCR